VDSLRYTDLLERVASVASYLRKSGVKSGDRVAGFVCNTAETLVAMLAASSLGAVWSSCSPDFGAHAVIERFRQISPKFLFATKSYVYSGKVFSCAAKIEEIVASIPSIEQCVLLNVTDTSTPDPSLNCNQLDYVDILKAEKSAQLNFEAVDFDHPLFILYSSGTTGTPKCITHGTGGTLLQHKKEHSIHVDLKPGSRILYYTTCGWMMWNWVVSALATKSCLVLYEGNPMHSEHGDLWQVVQDYKLDVLGTSPKYLQACEQQGISPIDDYDLSSLKTLLSTGSPLLPAQFDWVYDHVSKDIHLASISGGTDIISCFMLGVPTLPVYRGEIQAPGLAMAIECWNDEQKPQKGVKGELVCVQAFPSRPIFFWGDDKQHSKYKAAYFEHYEDAQIWRHGDFIEITESGGILVHGRSDATLNPGGVRIGTAEIYKELEKLEWLADSVVVERFEGDDSFIVLMCKPNDPSFDMNEALIANLKIKIKQSLSPRHVPKYVFKVADIPYTRSGKKSEIAVKSAVNHKKVSNSSSLSNPDSLGEFERVANQLDSYAKKA
jgi:acetoacetyl-CoA synthetase